MRCIWVVMMYLLSSVCLIGCKAQSRLHASSEEPLTGCTFQGHEDIEDIKEKVGIFFKREVGAKVTSVDIKRPSFCESRIVTPVVATTQATPFPRVWFVEIEGNGSGEMHLIRPE